jgi:hypothetical protein
MIEDGRPFTNSTHRVGNASSLSLASRKRATDQLSHYCQNRQCQKCKGSRRRKYGLTQLCGCHCHRYNANVLGDTMTY